MPAAAARPAPVAPARLSPGAPVERPIAAGEEHAYDLDLPAGAYVALSFRQIGIGVDAALAAPGGSRLAAAVPGERRTLARLDAIAEKAGRYRLTLAGRNQPGVRGRYRLTLDELRPARPSDDLRVQARRAFGAAILVHRTDGYGADARVIAELDRARQLFRRAGDRQGELDAAIERGFLRAETDPRGGRAELEQALGDARRAGYRGGEAKALDHLGETDTAGARETASAEFQRAFALWRELGDVAEQAEVAANLGYALSYAGDRKEAGSWLARGLALGQLAGDIEGEGNTWSAVGLLRSYAGDPGALACFRRGRALLRRSGNRQFEASLVIAEARMYQSWGQPQRALDLYQDPVLAGSWVDPALRALALHNNATLHFELGQFQQAREGYRQALALLPPGGDLSLELQAGIDLGLIAFHDGDLPAATASFQRALDRSANLSDRRTQAFALHCLGIVALARGQARVALDDFARALSLRQGADADAIADTEVAIGKAYRALGERDRAVRALRAPCSPAAGVRPMVRANCLKARARLESEGGDLDAARGDILEAIGQVETLFGGVQDDPLRTSLFATQRSFYDDGIDLLAELDRRRPGRSYDAQALALSENARARGLLDLIAEGRIELRQGIPEDLRKRQDEITRELAATLASRDQLSAAGGDLGKVSVSLDKLKRDQERLASDARRSNPRYARVRYPQPITARDVQEDIQRKLDRDTALLEYSLGEDASHLFVVTREGIRIFHLPPAAEIERHVEALLAAISTPNWLQRSSYRREASMLYGLLLPAGAAAKRNLLVVPDGALHLLPFEALLTETSKGPSPDRLPYLLRRQGSIAYVPSASVLSELRERRRPERWERLARLWERLTGRAPSFLAVADPAYSGTPSPLLAQRARGGPIRPDLAPLPGTRREVERIARLFLGSRLYLGPQATKANVLGNPLVATAERLQFATHGLLNEDEPELSGLALTPTGPRDDGMLRVSDVFNLSLRADLVVLSACETGRGKRVGGEGLVGLSRAFFYAGAPSLVVSLWPVADDSTADLMVDFYRRLKGGADKGEALREAKIAMVDGGRTHPFYWAPFILVGDPR